VQKNKQTISARTNLDISTFTKQVNHASGNLRTHQTMSLNYNPVAQSNPWQLKHDWRVFYDYTTKARKSKPSRKKSKAMGQVTSMKFTSTATIDGKRTTLLLVTTSKQNKKDPPLGLQVIKLDFKNLQTQDRRKMPHPKLKENPQKYARM
jgi:hypothetical protein